MTISLGKPSNERADATAVKYRCPECDQLYSSTAALKLHLQSHTGELAFRCHFCGRHFEREEERLAHIRQLHAPRPTIKGQSMVAREENGRAKGRDTHFKSSSSRTGAHVHPDNAEWSRVMMSTNTRNGAAFSQMPVSHLEQTWRWTGRRRRVVWAEPVHIHLYMYTHVSYRPLSYSQAAGNRSMDVVC